MDIINQERYARNLILIGEGGQRKLSNAKVLVIGAGGLGTTVLSTLTAAGVGNIGICDGDTVSESNLNRQFLYTPQDIGLYKVETISKRLGRLNNLVNFQLFKEFYNQENCQDMISGYDLIIDCLDNLEARLLLNDTCVSMGKPFIHGGVGEYSGQIMTVTSNTPCLRCLLTSDRQQTTKGVLAPMVSLVASFEAQAGLNYLLHDTILPLIIINGKTLEVNELTIAKKPNCICSNNPTTAQTIG